MKHSAVWLSSVLLAMTACTSSGTGVPSTGAADAGGQSTADAAAAVAIPFAVDDWYAPSGYMGDGEHTGAIVDGEQCDGDRAGDAHGICHRFTWSPSGEGWAGVFWQFPDGNWGDLPGLDVPAGATKVSFYAWGAEGGEVVSFMVGMADVDGFEVKDDQVVLAATPTRYTLSLAATGYGAVVGGFGWVAADSDAAITFHVDDIVWE